MMCLNEILGAQAPACELPAELQECCSRFETFYLAKHTGSKWLLHRFFICFSSFRHHFEGL